MVIKTFTLGILLWDTDDDILGAGNASFSYIYSEKEQKSFR
jgi:hypothetical protein